MKTMKLTKQDIIKISKNSKDNADYVLNLYKFYFTDWDNIKFINGHPSVSYNTDILIMDNIPDETEIVKFGLFWLDKGFSLNEKGKDFYIYPNKCKVIYNKAEVDC